MGRKAGFGGAAATATCCGRAVGSGTIRSTLTGLAFEALRLATAVVARPCFAAGVGVGAGAVSSLTSSGSLPPPNSRAKKFRFGRYVQ